MNAAKTRKLSPAMQAALAHGINLNPITGQVSCSIRHKATRNALLARGAEMHDHLGLRITLDLGLTLVAFEAFEAKMADSPETAKWADDYISWKVEAQGYVGSGYTGTTTMECWRRVRAGEMKAEVGEVGSWGCMITGWKFSPVADESAEQAA
ncbi:MAG: hypothetical protein ACYTFG_00080 [Planctomycetota bacterium]|jgi:hypothetical protein